jgi:cyclophilin family peptidyl-prolyl cis-trans isomerase
VPFWSRRPVVDQQPPAPQPLFDALEDRLVLFSDPFLAAPPDLSTLTSSQNTVIRMQTSQGLIDIELYDVVGPDGGSAAANTSNNFLTYIRQGRLDGTFFHRLINTPTPFVLQGGGFSLKDPLPVATPLYDTVVSNGNIQNEFGSNRSNIERTIAMAKLGNDPNSATSQFFFNLANNASSLDGADGGFTVFGHVVQGWNVVTTIAALQTRDLTQFLTGTASPPPPNEGLFQHTPVTGPNNTDVVAINEIDIIKPRNQTAFYTFSSYFSDGYRSGKSTDVITLVNSDASAGSVYEVIARFESGQRDRVVAQGFLAAGAHIDLTVYKANTPSIALVRGGAPLGYQIRSSKVIGAQINHHDFGSTAGESFVQAGAYDAASLESWSFANGQKGPGLASFVTWINMTDQDVSVTLVFQADNGTSFLITKVTHAFRRGGLDVNQLPNVASGLYSVSISADGAIAAALSQYRLAPARGATETGVVAGGATRGVLTGAIVPTNGQSIISALYTGQAGGTITVDLDFILSNGTVLTSPGAFVLSTSIRRRDLDLSTLNGGLPVGSYFTIRYRVRSDAAPIAMGFTSIGGGDTFSTSFQTASTANVYFGDGFTDPAAGANGAETISLFNPFTDPTVSFTYRVKFNFVGGVQVVLPTDMLAGGHRIDLDVRSLATVMAQIGMGAQFHHYSITIESTATRGGNPVDGAIFAQLTRLDPTGGGTVTTGPSLDGSSTAVFFTDPRFAG